MKDPPDGTEDARGAAVDAPPPKRFRGETARPQPAPSSLRGQNGRVLSSKTETDLPRASSQAALLLRHDLSDTPAKAGSQPPSEQRQRQSIQAEPQAVSAQPRNGSGTSLCGATGSPNAGGQLSLAEEGWRPPNIHEALSKLELTAKEVFAGNGERLPAFASEQKLADLLQQLWAWAVQLGKVQPDAPVTVPRLVLVAQWGLQRMRAGAVQGKDAHDTQRQHSASLWLAGSGPMHCEASLRPRIGLAALDRSTSVAASLAAAQRQPAQPGQERQQNEEGQNGSRAEVPEATAAATTLVKQEPKEATASQEPDAATGPGPPAAAGGQQVPRQGQVGTLLSSWLHILQSAAAHVEGKATSPKQQQRQHDDEQPQTQEQQEQAPPQQQQSGGVSRPRPVRPVPVAGLGGALPASHLLASVCARSPQQGSGRNHAAAASQGGAQPGTGKGLCSPPALAPQASHLLWQHTSPPTAPHAAAKQHQLSPTDMLYFLGDLTGAELAEDPAFTSALQGVLRNFDVQLAAQRIGFSYVPSELRQACAFIVHNLEHRQKHFLAQDAEELFFVVLQACGLVQHMEQKVRDLQESIGRKVARIAAVLEGCGEGGKALVQPQGGSMVWLRGEWQRDAGGGSANGLLGLKSAVRQQLQQHQQQQQRQASVPWVQPQQQQQQQQRGAAVQSSSAPELQASATRSHPLAALQADLVRRSSSRGFGAEAGPLQQQGSGSVDPSAVGSAGSRGSGGSHGSKGAGPPLVPSTGQQQPPSAAADTDVQRTAIQLMEIMHAQLRKRETLP